MKITTILVAVAAILILGGGGAWWYLKQQAIEEAAKYAPLPTVSDYASSPADDVSSTTGITGPGVSVSLPKTVTVTYTAKGGFSPTTTLIMRGDTVTFQAEDETSMWVGVADHPSHTKYDDTDLKTHCVEGATPSFDQCKTGSSFSFTFNKAGTFGYHNHVGAPQKGTIIVQ